jgi:hypothetical protein
VWELVMQEQMHGLRQAVRSEIKWRPEGVVEC